MRLDIRLPIGLMFTVLGALLVVVGLLGGKSFVEQSQGTNVNLWNCSTNDLPPSSPTSNPRGRT